MPDKTPQWMPTLIFSHRYPFTFIASELGYEVGTKVTEVDTNSVHKLVDAGYEIHFIDNNFENPNFERIERVVSEYRPSYVVCPDIYHEDSLERVVSFGKGMIDEYGATPMIVPKTKFDLDKIPDGWVIGFSVPSGYGETDVSIEHFAGRDVHLLGGSHRNQIAYANKAVDVGANIVSVDGNAFARAASYGNVINDVSSMMQRETELKGNAWNADVDGYTQWGQRIIVSLVRNYEMWRVWSSRRLRT